MWYTQCAQRRKWWFKLQSWPKCVGHCAFFPNCCNIRSLPPSATMQCWTTLRQAFPYEQHCMGGGGEGRIWPKERVFPCEKLIDGRGSAFCKLVPHNFGQDCLNVEIKHKSGCIFHIIQRMDVKLDMVIVRDVLHVFHPNVAIRREI